MKKKRFYKGGPVGAGYDIAKDLWSDEDDDETDDEKEERYARDALEIAAAFSKGGLVEEKKKSHKRVKTIVRSFRNKRLKSLKN